MMTETSLHVIIAAYDTEQAALRALQDVMHATKEGQIDIEGIALVEKDPDGKIKIKDTADVSTGRGAAIGGVIGGVLGLIAGPAGVVLLGGAGALIGGALTAGDEGIPDERLMKLGDELAANTSAVVVIASDAWVSEVESQLAATAQRVTSREIDPETVARLETE